MNESGPAKAPEKASDNSSGPYTRKTAAEATAFLCLFSLLFLAGARENIFQRIDHFADGAVVAAKRLDQAENLIDQSLEEIHTIVLRCKNYELPFTCLYFSINRRKMQGKGKELTDCLRFHETRGKRLTKLSRSFFLCLTKDSG